MHLSSLYTPCTVVMYTVPLSLSALLDVGPTVVGTLSGLLLFSLFLTLSARFGSFRPAWVGVIPALTI